MSENDKPVAIEDSELESTQGAGSQHTGENLYVSGAEPAMQRQKSQEHYVGENLYISSQGETVWRGAGTDNKGDLTASIKKHFPR